MIPLPVGIGVGLPENPATTVKAFDLSPKRPVALIGFPSVSSSSPAVAAPVPKGTPRLLEPRVSAESLAFDPIPEKIPSSTALPPVFVDIPGADFSEGDEVDSPNGTEEPPLVGRLGFELPSNSPIFPPATLPGEKAYESFFEFALRADIGMNDGSIAAAEIFVDDNEEGDS